MFDAYLTDKEERIFLFLFLSSIEIGNHGSFVDQMFFYIYISIYRYEHSACCCCCFVQSHSLLIFIDNERLSPKCDCVPLVPSLWQKVAREENIFILFFKKESKIVTR